MADAESAPIVVGVDFSKNGRKAFDAAVNLADDLGATLVVVHAFPEMKTPSLMVGDLGRKVIDEARAEISNEEAMTLAEEWVSVARKRDLDVVPVAADGKPSDLILEQADAHNAGIIVVGTHGRTGLKRVLLGSVAEDVVRRSKRPVLVIPMAD